ncbi:MAG: hypothetical protein A3D28_06245 [Omnitrophica bacterium RIFCSPHIGHO2_02_FULL_63_14]|nr:MAG: hypothetical protein A3D28_06245 [Omnitrophica bacterium RIFCSPHIGHO2_02_FULL_63_14]
MRRAFRFIADSFSFSNPLELIAVKALTHGALLTYRYKGYRIASCEIACRDDMAVKECLVKKTYRAALERSRPSGRGRYVNIGAHIGAFDVAAHGTWGRETRGVSVEMNPWTYARLVHNIYWNRLNVRPVHAAVTGQKGVVMVDPLRSHTGQSIFDRAEGSGLVEVPSIPLSDVPDPEPGAPIDLLKIDCEGAEYQLVLGARPEDFGRFRHIVMELHAPPPGREKQEVIRHLREQGRFQVETLTEGIHSLIFCFRK